MPIWKNSIDLAEDIFKLTNNLPKKEDYGFTSQIRRSALSISANIAEGYGRTHTYDKLNFYYFARGSLMETLSHLEYAKRVGYISNEEVLSLTERLDRIHKELNSIAMSLKK